MRNINTYIKRHNNHTTHRKQHQTPNIKELYGEKENIKVKFLLGRGAEKGWTTAKKGRRDQEKKETRTVYMI